MKQFLGSFERLVLMSIVGGLSEGSQIQDKISSITGNQISAGAIYTTLGRLEAKKFITHTVAPSQPYRGGRARNIYSATDIARKHLAAFEKAVFKIKKKEV